MQAISLPWRISEQTGGRTPTSRGPGCVARCLRYLNQMTDVMHAPVPTRDYTLPEGCPSCGADLPVRVSAAGANGVCKHCGWFGRPLLTVTHQGLRVSYQGAQA